MMEKHQLTDVGACFLAQTFLIKIALPRFVILERAVVAVLFILLNDLILNLLRKKKRARKEVLATACKHRFRSLPYTSAPTD